MRKGLAPETRRCPPGLYNSTGSLARKPTEMGPFGNGGCQGGGRLTAPCTPRRGHPAPGLTSPGSRSPLVAPEGRSSVVTFRFIEKASVRPLSGPQENGPAEPGGGWRVPPGQPRPQDQLLRSLKLEASASDPLLASCRSPGETRPHEGRRDAHSLTTSCLSSSLTNGLQAPPRDVPTSPWLQVGARGPTLDYIQPGPTDHCVLAGQCLAVPPAELSPCPAHRPCQVGVFLWLTGCPENR